MTKATKTIKAAIVAKTGVPADKVIVSHVTAKPALADRIAKAEAALHASKTARPVVKQPTKDIRPSPKMPLKTPIHEQGKAKGAPRGKASEKQYIKATAAPAANQKITLLVKENPKRAGTASHKRFALYSKHATSEAYVAAGGLSADLAWDAKRGFIKLT